MSAFDPNRTSALLRFAPTFTSESFESVSRFEQKSLFRPIAEMLRPSAAFAGFANQ
jgi:hypothetical protein